MLFCSQSTGSRVDFYVQCRGPCKNVKITIRADSGDPDLFGYQYSRPPLKDRNCAQCSSVCSSRAGAGKTDTCTVSTSTRFFYVTVVAYSSHGKGTIKFENALKVKTI